MGRVMGRAMGACTLGVPYWPLSATCTTVHEPVGSANAHITRACWFLNEHHCPFITAPRHVVVLIPKKSRNVFRVGIFLGSVGLATRTMHLHEACVRGARQNRTDPPWG